MTRACKGIHTGTYWRVKATVEAGKIPRSALRAVIYAEQRRTRPDRTSRMRRMYHHRH